MPPALSERAVVAARRLARDLSEDGGVRTRFAEADRQSDFGHGILSLSQHELRPLDPPDRVVPMRRNAERLLERPAKMKGAQPSQTRQRGERNLLG